MATFKLVTQRLISVSGADAFKFLQALTTNDIALVSKESANGGHVLPSLFLASNGRVFAQALVSRGLNSCANTFFLDTDPASADGLVQLLARRRLAAQVEFHLLGGADSVNNNKSLDKNVTVYARIGVKLNGNDDGATVQGPTTMIDARIPSLKMQRFYAFNQQIREKAHPQMYHQLIMGLHGLSEGVHVAHLKLMPQDLNFQHFGYLCKSNKGCFVGQEYMNRIANRTLINKYSLCLVFCRRLLEERESNSFTSWAPWLDSIDLMDSLAAKIIAKTFGKDPKVVFENIITPRVAIQEAICKDVIVLTYYNTGFGLALAPRGSSKLQTVEINGREHQIAIAA